MTSRARAFAASLLVGLAGCESEQLVNRVRVEDARTWANTASAVAVYAHVYGPIAFADGEETFADPDCPVTADDGTTVTIEGGCAEEAGRQWAGSATIVRTEGGSRELTMDAYGSFFDPEEAASTTGTAELRRLGPASHEFDVHVVHEGGMTTEIWYTGTVEGDYGTASTWNGSGEVNREGMVEPTGTVLATTVDELLDDSVCAGQAVSGRTTIDNGSHEIVVTYDGATDCDSEQAARWSIDGRDRGLVTGVVCSTSGAGAPASPPSAGLLLVGLAVLTRLRRARWRRAAADTRRRPT